jgi:hypothetical protein
MPIISAILAILKILTMFDKWIPIIRRMFQKDPVEQVKEAEKAHDEAAKKAERDNDTGGSFGG